MKFSDFCAFKEGRGQAIGSGTPTADMNCGGKGGKPGPCPKKVSQTDSPEFKKWFKGSVVTYEDGTPMVMYHGTTADFESFRQHSLHSRGHFFTDDPRLATSYGSGLGGHIKPVYLSIKNPVPQKVRQNMYAEHGSLLIDELVKLGYDGIVYERNHLAIAFHPHQIKSAIGNRGTFDPNSPNILNVFCPNGPGGGVDPSCSPGKAGNVNPKVLAWAKEKFGDTEKAKNFAEWFGDSKVVDDNGEPLVVYHGTRKDFTEFDPGRTEQGLIFLSDDPAEASEFARIGFGARVIPAFVTMANPLRVDFHGELYTPEQMEQSAAEAKHGGYDGLIVRNIVNFEGGQSSTSYAVFKPTQIKSATGNAGTFDPRQSSIIEWEGR